VSILTFFQQFAAVKIASFSLLLIFPSILKFKPKLSSSLKDQFGLLELVKMKIIECLD
jgi:hypothetical protein